MDEEDEEAATAGTLAVVSSTRCLRTSCHRIMAGHRSITFGWLVFRGSGLRICCGSLAHTSSPMPGM